MRIFGTVRPGLADVITLGNALAGVAAVAVVVATPWAHGDDDQLAVLRVATLIILGGVVLDVCDGAVARVRGGTALGPYLDSLADAAAFGVAPAVVVGALAMRHAAAGEVAALAVGSLAYVAAALVRLADFDAGRSRDVHFTGMPSPLGAASALAVGLLGLSPWVTTAGLLLIAWLMVSGIRYPRSRGRGLIAEAVGLAVAVVGIVGLIDVRWPAAIVLVATMVAVPLVYAVVGGGRGTDAAAEASPDPIERR